MGRGIRGTLPWPPTASFVQWILKAVSFGDNFEVSRSPSDLHHFVLVPRTVTRIIDLGFGLRAAHPPPPSHLLPLPPGQTRPHCQGTLAAECCVSLSTAPGTWGKARKGDRAT